MKTLKMLTLVILFISFTSCGDDDSVQLLEVASKTVTNLHAPQIGGQGQGEESGKFTKFDFASGEITTSDTDWDIAFRGTKIVVNGGAKIGLTDEPEKTKNASIAIVSNVFAEVTQAPNTSEFKQDAANTYGLPWGSDLGWYNYAGPPTFLISPIAGKVIIVKTHTGNYAKMEILSYYKDTDITKENRYFTFNYVFNPNIGVATF